MSFQMFFSSLPNNLSCLLWTVIVLHQDIPEDPTGRFDDFKDFVNSNIEMFQWIALLIVLAQVPIKELKWNFSQPNIIWCLCFWINIFWQNIKWTCCPPFVGHFCFISHGVKNYWERATIQLWQRWWLHSNQ